MASPVGKHRVKDKYLERGVPVRSDETKEERRDAARRRLREAMHELSDRASPGNAVKRNPLLAAGVALGVGYLVSHRRRVAPQVRYVYREPEARPAARRGRRAVAEQAADKAADKASIRTLILSAVGTAIVGALRDRFLKPNLERWTEQALSRFGWGDPAAKPGDRDGNDRNRDRREPAGGWRETGERVERMVIEPGRS